MYSIGVQRLAALIAECSKALGKTITNPTVQKVLIAAASAAAGSITTQVISDQNDKRKKTEDEEKELLYKDALAKSDAIIRKLQAEADLSKERQDHLVNLNNRLLEQLEKCKIEDANEQI